MTAIEEIIAALLLAGPGDMKAVRQYLGWMKFRRQVNDRFYLAAHWAKSSNKYHWVGRQ